MYIACLCPNLVSVHFYAIPYYYTSNFLNAYLLVLTCIALGGVLVLTSVLQESQGLTINAYQLLLVMISLHMLTFRLIVFAH